ncbi:MAG: hypothetical protein ACYC7E_04740 [Armatimonadota bacterium]
MTLSDLVQAMRIDLGDVDGDLFADMALERCVIRAIYPVGQDTGHPLNMVNGEIAPTPEGSLAEVLLLLAESYACGVMRGKTANAVNVSSGDKRIERNNQAKSWAELEADLLARYRQRITEMSGGDFFITPPPLRPVMYEQGSEVIEYELCE